MSIVFISGSASIKVLSPLAIEKLQREVNLGTRILVGDCQGVDTLVQTYLHNIHYTDVSVYHMGQCRNNVGNFTHFEIANPDGLSGRPYFTIKDRAMADATMCGLVFWDGKSQGSKANIERMLRMYKPVGVVHGEKWSVYRSMGQYHMDTKT